MIENTDRWGRFTDMCEMLQAEEAALPSGFPGDRDKKGIHRVRELSGLAACLATGTSADELSDGVPDEFLFRFGSARAQRIAASALLDNLIEITPGDDEGAKMRTTARGGSVRKAPGRGYYQFISICIPSACLSSCS